jgi:hypothetical protein
MQKAGSKSPPFLCDRVATGYRQNNALETRHPGAVRNSFHANPIQQIKYLYRPESAAFLSKKSGLAAFSRNLFLSGSTQSVCY